MLKHILLDLDETIFDFKKAEKMAINQSLSDIGIEPTEGKAKRYSEINLMHWKMLERGEIERKDLKVRRFTMLLDELGSDYSPEKMHNKYEGYLSSGHYYIEGAEELLKYMHERYDVYIVSNGSISTQNGRIASSNIEEYVDRIFISEEVGYDKPSVEFFEECFGNIEEFNKNNCIIIGDSLSSDIRGGKNFDVRTIWVNRYKEKNNTDLKPTYEVNNLSEIYAILEEL